MALLFEVVTEVTLPIILLMVFGWFGQRRLGFDVTTLNRVVIYGALPALFVDSLSKADLPVGEVQFTVAFTVVQRWPRPFPIPAISASRWPSSPSAPTW